MKKKLSLTILLGCLTVLTPGGMQAAEASPDELADYDQQLIKLQAARELKAAGASPELKQYFAELGQQLIDAASSGDLNQVNELISAGVNVNATTMDGWTSLMVAAKAGNQELVKALFEAGADSTMTNNKGKTAADLATRPIIKKMIKDNQDKIELENFEDGFYEIIEYLRDVYSSKKYDSKKDINAIKQGGSPESYKKFFKDHESKKNYKGHLDRLMDLRIKAHTDPVYKDDPLIKFLYPKETHQEEMAREMKRITPIIWESLEKHEQQLTKDPGKSKQLGTKFYNLLRSVRGMMDINMLGKDRRTMLDHVKDLGWNKAAEELIEHQKVLEKQ